MKQFNKCSNRQYRDRWRIDSEGGKDTDKLWTDSIHPAFDSRRKDKEHANISLSTCIFAHCCYFVLSLSTTYIIRYSHTPHHKLPYMLYLSPTRTPIHSLFIYLTHLLTHYIHPHYHTLSHTYILFLSISDCCWTPINFLFCAVIMWATFQTGIYDWTDQTLWRSFKGKNSSINFKTQIPSRVVLNWQ